MNQTTTLSSKILTLKPTISITQTTPSLYKLFSSGEPVLDAYLRRYAKNHERIHLGRTFVLINEGEKEHSTVMGYYTLSSAQLRIDDLPDTYKEQLPRYPIPASRLCRLAVDMSFQGKGIGSHLLADAIKRVLQADASIAIHSLIVDAKHEKAKKFYSQFGFIPLAGSDLTLFLPLETLKKAMVAQNRKYWF